MCGYVGGANMKCKQCGIFQAVDPEEYCDVCRDLFDGVPA